MDPGRGAKRTLIAAETHDDQLCPAIVRDGANHVCRAANGRRWLRTPGDRSTCSASALSRSRALATRVSSDSSQGAAIATERSTIRRRASAPASRRTVARARAAYLTPATDDSLKSVAARICPISSFAFTRGTPDSSLSGTASTGTCVRRKRRSVVDPSSHLRRPPSPCVPITIKSTASWPRFQG